MPTDRRKARKGQPMLPLRGLVREARSDTVVVAEKYVRELLEEERVGG